MIGMPNLMKDQLMYSIMDIGTISLPTLLCTIWKKTYTMHQVV